MGLSKWARDVRVPVSHVTAPWALPQRLLIGDTFSGRQSVTCPSVPRLAQPAHATKGRW